MNKHDDLPRPASELEHLADYYDSHDTSDEMDAGTGPLSQVADGLAVVLVRVQAQD